MSDRSTLGPELALVMTAPTGDRGIWPTDLAPSADARSASKHLAWKNSCTAERFSLIRVLKIPVPSRWEFDCKPLNWLAVCASKSQKEAGIDEIPCKFP
jgi:hypothetical protein